MLAPRLAGDEFALVLTSAAGSGPGVPPSWPGSPTAEVDEDLVEWGYGDYEGITTDEIRESVPGWTVWTHPCPGGETAEQVSARLDRVVARCQGVGRGRPAVRPRALAAGAGRALAAGCRSPRGGC